eukprot:CAMPEP_0197860578 /NCGR_PEP_ID=MMETSP1438-20131217/36026_1 /TAXON_ID=1461541 /ORGANISM="Pterosperma sp., Strain CCMP1384" /LENGTH=45 /DNA_ID= /DNA_START= /DNA_END= /DNA_ORIENTATION=
MATQSWSKLAPTGTAPSCRGGHTATIVGSKLWIFGGEDPKRQLLN